MLTFGRNKLGYLCIKRLIIGLVMLSLNCPMAFSADQRQVIENEKETIIIEGNTIKIIGHHTQEELDYYEKLRQERMKKLVDLAKEKEKEMIKKKQAEEKTKLERNRIVKQREHELAIAAKAPKMTYGIIVQNPYSQRSHQETRGKSNSVKNQSSVWDALDSDYATTWQQMQVYQGAVPTSSKFKFNPQLGPFGSFEYLPIKQGKQQLPVVDYAAIRRGREEKADWERRMIESNYESKVNWAYMEYPEINSAEASSPELARALGGPAGDRREKRNEMISEAQKERDESLAQLS